MLLPHIETKPKYEFLVDHRDGRRILLLADRVTIDAHGGIPLWNREAGDDDSLRAMVRWVGARRERWDEWGDLARKLGAYAFAAYMAQLWEAEPPAHVVGMVISPGEDPKELQLGESLNGPNGFTMETLYVHRFATAQARTAFVRWLNTNSRSADGLIQLGYSKGTIALGLLLDEIAEEMASKAAPRGRRRGRGTRMAA